MDKNDNSNQLAVLSANYVQLSGMLAGFCAAFIIFLLSPGLFPQPTSEITIILLILATFGYTYSAGLSAYAPKLPNKTQAEEISLANSLFLLSNILVWLAFSIIVYSLGYKWAFALSLVLLALTIIGPKFHRHWRKWFRKKAK